MPEAFFNEADEDQDGMLSKEELFKMRGLTKAEKESIWRELRQYDDDGNNMIDKQEFDMLRAKMQSDVSGIFWDPLNWILGVCIIVQVCESLFNYWIPGKANLAAFWSKASIHMNAVVSVVSAAILYRQYAAATRITDLLHESFEYEQEMDEAE